MDSPSVMNKHIRAIRRGAAWDAHAGMRSGGALTVVLQLQGRGGPDSSATAAPHFDSYLVKIQSDGGKGGLQALLARGACVLRA